jgi:hypothetical protein
MLMTKVRKPAIRTLQGWTIAVLQDAGAIQQYEAHSWMHDRADPHARDRASKSPAKNRLWASLLRRPWSLLPKSWIPWRHLPGVSAGLGAGMALPFNA